MVDDAASLPALASAHPLDLIHVFQVRKVWQKTWHLSFDKLYGMQVGGFKDFSIFTPTWGRFPF